MLKRSVLVLVVAMAGATLATTATAHADSPVHLVYSFERCFIAASCATLVPDDSGRDNAGTVVPVTGGRLVLVPGRHGKAVLLAGAIIRLEQSADSAAFSPGTRSFAFGASVKMDAPFPGDANLFQRGVFSDTTNQWKLQLDATRQGCVIKGDQGRVLVFSPTDLPGDGRWHTVACVVTPGWISYVVDGKAFSVPNTAGSVTFSDTEKVEIGGRIRPDGTINDPFEKPFDEVFFSLL